MSANYFIVYNKHSDIEFTTKNRWAANSCASNGFESEYILKEYYIS
jgi:hypothetical protein